MGEPNSHTASRMTVQMAVAGSPSQAVTGRPNEPRRALIGPCLPNISRQTTATATLAPTIDGA